MSVSPPEPSTFPARISRRLSLALTAIIVMVLLVGGISLALAIRISRINEAIDRENSHIQITDQIQATFQRISFELHQIHAAGWVDRMRDVEALHQELTRHLETFRDLHRGEENFPEEQQELTLFSALVQSVIELRALTDRMLVGPGRSGRLGPVELAQLDLTFHQMARKADDLNGIHRVKVSRLLQASQGMMRTIVALYLGFLVVGGALIALASIAFTRGIAAPLRALANAAREIAEGRLDKKVAVRSPDEVGQLSHAFNVMADRLQARERDLRAAHDQLEQKVRETQTLYRIGTEILGLHQLDRILQSVVEKARELLRSEAAALCMLTQEQDELVAVATSGPADAFRPSRSPADHRPAARTPLGPAGLEAHVRQCAIFQPEFLQAHLAAPLTGADKVIGMLCIGGRSPRTFVPAETELLKGLATQAALAIENARLTENVRSLATLEERERLAREMHDGLAQALALIRMRLHSLDEMLAGGDPAGGRAIVAELRDVSAGALQDVRQAIFDLRVMVSRDPGLLPTLTEYLHEFSVESGIRVEFGTDGTGFELLPQTELQLMRVLQEALRNVRCHARATVVLVRLQRAGDAVQLIVKDDGCGFDPSRATSAGSHRFGLATMRERTEAVAGTFHLQSQPGQGTTIEVTLPLRDPEV
jgi:nitrate/nitrite-specific signal transduction histidine kinase